MKNSYRIYVVGDIPPDLKDRIAAIHAAGILKGKNGDLSINVQTPKDPNRGTIKGAKK